LKSRSIFETKKVADEMLNLKNMIEKNEIYKPEDIFDKIQQILDSKNIDISEIKKNEFFKKNIA